MQLRSEDKSIDMYLAVAQAPAALAGPIDRQISALARRFDLAIHYVFDVFAEQDGDNLYNAAQIFGSEGM